MLSVCVLASGSRGNSIYVSDGDTAILLDAGLSGVEIQRRMKKKGLSPDSLTAIIVTHEHFDHIKGVGVLSRRFKLPVYMNMDTRLASSCLGQLNNVKLFECGTMFSIGDLFIHPFSVPHDAMDPTGFALIKGSIKVALITDLGVVTQLVREKARQCDLLMLESNYDSGMLMNSSYPWYLKQRIKGKNGHLSNDSAAQLIGDVCHDKLKHVILIHLSEENNSAFLALQRVKPVLSSCDVSLNVASQESGSEVFFLK